MRKRYTVLAEQEMGWTMKTILAAIMKHKKAYAKLPLFQFMRNEELSAWERVSFYPCMAHFILSFGDLNKFVLRDETSTDPLQKLVNEHSYEDDHHWPWYLEDLSKLGFDKVQNTSDYYRFLWGDETVMNRVLMYKLTALLMRVTPMQKMAIIEAIEETGNVLFNLTSKLADRLSDETGIEFRYLGDFHLAKETGHAMNSDHRELCAIEMSEEMRAETLVMVEQVFAWFAEWTQELLAYAQKHPVTAPRALRVLPARQSEEAMVA